MWVLKTRAFARWARREGLSDWNLQSAVAEMESGLIDASLGSQLVKKRIAGAGRGKSGSYRTIIAYQSRDRAIFIVGFAKAERSNVSVRELEGLKKLAKLYLDFNNRALRDALDAGALLEVTSDE
jgi:hypothetical protein